MVFQDFRLFEDKTVYGNLELVLSLTGKGGRDSESRIISTLTMLGIDRLHKRYPRELSGGVKTLILMNHDREHIFNASACGDNCAKWILRIGEEKDLFIRLGYLMDFGNNPFTIEIKNLNKVVHNKKELYEAVLDNALI